MATTTENVVISFDFPCLWSGCFPCSGVCGSVSPPPHGSGLRVACGDVQNSSCLDGIAGPCLGGGGVIMLNNDRQ